jgi:hypothetical protein
MKEAVYCHYALHSHCIINLNKAQIKRSIQIIKGIMMNKRSIPSTIALIILVGISTTNLAFASLITIDLLSSPTARLLSYQNPYTDAFTQLGDGFQIYQREQSLSIPDTLLDDSSSKNDDQGIVDSTNLTAFFGIVDTINGDNLSSFVTASWDFDITNLELQSLSMDMAAMGDFETSDSFNWQYSVDNSPFTSLFNGMVNQDLDQDYRLEDGVIRTLNDPLVVNSIRLNNQLTSFSSNFVGSGKQLRIHLNAKVNGHEEALVFQNITLSANTISAIEVSEPNLLILFVFALLGIHVRIKKRW